MHSTVCQFRMLFTRFTEAEAEAGDEIGALLPLLALSRDAASVLLQGGCRSDVVYVYFAYARWLVLEEEEYARAMELIEHAIALDATFSRLYLLKAFCCRELGLLDDAEKAFQKTNSLLAQAEVCVQLAEVAERNGASEERVVGILREALEVDPDCEEAHFLLGRWLYFERDECEAAMLHLQRAVEIDRDYGIAHNILGQVYRDTWRQMHEADCDEAMSYLDKAIVHLQQALTLGVSDVFLYVHLHNSHWLKGNIRKANEVALAMLQAFPDMGECYLWYGQFLQGTGASQERVDEMFEKARALGVESEDA